MLSPATMNRRPACSDPVGQGVHAGMADNAFTNDATGA